MTRQTYQRDLVHQEQRIQLQIVRSRRRTLALHVFRGGRVELRAPLKCAWRDIDDFLAQRLNWIVGSMEKLRDEPVPVQPRYRQGAIHNYLGSPRVLQLSSGKGRGWLDDHGIHLRCTTPADESKVSNRLFAFYREQCQPVFEARLRVCAERFPEVVVPQGLRVRRMRARWGSCSSSGEICLNTLLVQKSVRCIDLVINHELCHLRHFGHDAAFYALMDRAMPDWRLVEPELSRVQTEPLQLSLL